MSYKQIYFKGPLHRAILGFDKHFLSSLPNLTQAAECSIDLKLSMFYSHNSGLHKLYNTHVPIFLAFLGEEIFRAESVAVNIIRFFKQKCLCAINNIKQNHFVSWVVTSAYTPVIFVTIWYSEQRDHTHFHPIRTQQCFDCLQVIPTEVLTYPSTHIFIIKLRKSWYGPLEAT